VSARRLSRSILLALVVALSAAVSASANEPTVTEYQTGLTINSGPWGITKGPGDELWFAQNSINGVGSIAADTFVISELGSLPVVGDLRGIAEGPDGNLWVAEAASPGKIARITPAGVVTEWQADPNPSFPVDITKGPDGNLWFVSQSPEFVGRITPDGTITRFDVGLTPNSDLSSITEGPDGALWFTESANPGRIGRITTDGVITEYSAGLTPNMAPSDITEGPDGALWFTENANPGGIGRITTAGEITEFSAGLTPNAAPLSIGQGGDGALWFTESADPGAIGRITTDGVITEHRAGLTDNISPWDITEGPDGNMWFTGKAHPGRIARITVPPGVKDNNAQHVSETGATLRAKIAANAQDTYYYFEYGPTTEFGSQTDTVYAGNGWRADHFTAEASGLVEGAKYYFRPVVTNDAGTTIGDTRSFVTKIRLTETEPAPDKEKRPDFAESVVAAAQDGTIRFRPPGSRRWRRMPLGGAEIPVGATVDARRGSVSLTSAGSAGATQTGSFGGGIFSVHQPRRARGRVDLRLRGGDFSVCKRARRARSSGVVAGASRVRRVRRLWGRDRGGRFRTHGRHSHATVRGTRWLTEDRCGGTFTRVTQGAVVVRDVARRRSIVVRAGRSYLAKRRVQRRH
jgi:virginiamycin B lyase